MVLYPAKRFAVIAHCGDISRLLSLNKRKKYSRNEYAAL